MDYSHLKEIPEPIYDTLMIERFPSTQYSLFQNHLGKSDEHGPKTLKGTNMLLGGCLGYPIHAKWSWMRFIFEDWCHASDVREVVSNASIEFLVSSVPVTRKALSVFDPIFPRGGERIMKEWLEKKEIEFWPWFETSFKEVKLSPTEPFTVSVNFMGLGRLHGPIRAKVVFGPTLLVPDEYRQIHPEDRDSMMGPDFGDPVDPA